MKELNRDDNKTNMNLNILMTSEKELQEMKTKSRNMLLSTVEILERRSTTQVLLFAAMENILNWLRETKTRFKPSHRQIQITKTIMTTLICLHCNRIPKVGITHANNIPKKLKERFEEKVLDVIQKEQLAFPTDTNSKRLTFDYNDWATAISVWEGDNEY